MLLVIVYVGAVAVLFLFVVMMLNIDFAELRAGFVRNFPFGLAVAFVLLAELVLGIGVYRSDSLVLGTPDGTAATLVGRSAISSIRGAALQPLSVPVRKRGPDPAGGHDRRHRPDASRPQGFAQAECQQAEQPPAKMRLST